MLRINGATERQIRRDHRRWLKGQGPWLAAAAEMCPPTAVYPENIDAFFVFGALRSQWCEPGDGGGSFRLPLSDIEIAVGKYCRPVFAHTKPADAEEIERESRDLMARVLVMVQAARPVMTERRIEAIERARENR